MGVYVGIDQRVERALSTLCAGENSTTVREVCRVLNASRIDVMIVLSTLATEGKIKMACGKRKNSITIEVVQ